MPLDLLSPVFCTFLEINGLCWLRWLASSDGSQLIARALCRFSWRYCAARLAPQHTYHCSVFWPARNAIISWLGLVVRLLVQLPCKHPRNNLWCSIGFNDEARPQSHSWSLGRMGRIFVSRCDGNVTKLIHALLPRHLPVINRMTSRTLKLDL